MSHLKYSQPSNRAYATLSVKTSARDDGTFVGVASTPALDRVGDSLLPEGAVFKLPLPCLWQHDHSKPIGHITSARVTSRGIEITGKIAVGATLEIDNYYKLIKAGLVQGLSVGFRALETPEVTRTGLLYRSWEMMEVSAVTLPCNTAATITSVKSACGVASVHRSIPLVSSRGGSIPLISRGGSIPLTSGPVSLRAARQSKSGRRSDGSVKLDNPAIRRINKYGIRLVGSR